MGFQQNFGGFLESALQLQRGDTTLEAITNNSIFQLRTKEPEIVTYMNELTSLGMRLPSIEGFQQELLRDNPNLQAISKAFLASSFFRLGWRDQLSNDVLVRDDFQTAISALSLSRRKVWQLIQHVGRLNTAHPLGLLAEVSINQILKSILSNLTAIDPEFGYIDWKLELSAPATTICDELRIHLLLNELITNAIGSMMQRNAGDRWEWIPGLKEHKIVIKTYLDGDIFVSVRDTSHGIPAEQLQYIGFFGATALISTNTNGGMGIGLAEGKQTAEQHGGKLDVQSSTFGTEVIVRLPRIA